MSRRDTIIVAVLVNAGLLIVLFASALKSNAPSGDFVAAPSPIVQESQNMALKKEPMPAVGDEVDLALSQFAQPPVVAAQNPPSAQMSMTSPVAAPSNFADDLKAIGAPENPASPAEQAPVVHTLANPLENKQAPEFSEIKVKKGDMLEKIARHNHCTVAEIMKANKLTTTNLRIGQVLKIPHKSLKKAETSAVAFATPTASLETGAKYYTVKKGDSPWTIAVKNHLKVEDLLKLNNMNEAQARRLKPGDQLRIQ